MKKQPTMYALYTFGALTWFVAPGECQACGATAAVAGVGETGEDGRHGEVRNPDVVVYECGWAVARPPRELRFREVRPCRGVSLLALAREVLAKMRAAQPPALAAPEKTSAFAQATAALAVAVNAMERVFGAPPDVPEAGDGDVLDRR